MEIDYITHSMLSKQYRLTKNKDFERVAKIGQSVYTKELGIKWTKSNLSHSRFGIVVSLKIAKKAVVRNKIKRRIRAILFGYLKTIKPRYDIMILTKPGVINLDFWQLKKKIETLLSRAQLI